MVKGLDGARIGLVRALCVAAALVTAACSSSGVGSGGGGDGMSSGSGSGGSALALGITQYAPASRTAAPAMAGTTLEGGKLALSDYAGDVAVVNAWGSWCTECRLEEPALEQTYRAYQAKGVRFIGLNDHDDNAAALAYSRTFGVTYPSLQDPDETLLLQFRTMIPATDIPSSVIVDRHGRIAARVIGPVTAPQLKQLLDAVLAEKA